MPAQVSASAMVWVWLEISRLETGALSSSSVSTTYKPSSSASWLVPTLSLLDPIPGRSGVSNAAGVIFLDIVILGVQVSLPRSLITYVLVPAPAMGVMVLVAVCVVEVEVAVTLVCLPVSVEVPRRHDETKSWR